MVASGGHETTPSQCLVGGGEVQCCTQRAAKAECLRGMLVQNHKPSDLPSVASDVVSRVRREEAARGQKWAGGWCGQARGCGRRHAPQHE